MNATITHTFTGTPGVERVNAPKKPSDTNAVITHTFKFTPKVKRVAAGLLKNIYNN